jgi:hypothetical protein
VCRPPINLLHYCKVLLDYSIWIVIVVHSSLIMLLIKLLYLILSLIIFCFIMKNSTPLARARGGAHPPPPHPPSKSIPGLNFNLGLALIQLWTTPAPFWSSPHTLINNRGDVFLFDIFDHNPRYEAVSRTQIISFLWCLARIDFLKYIVFWTQQ